MLNSFDYITPIKGWCYKVLPLVYDDSLSYYELLNKVVKKVNEMIETIDNLPSYIAELLSEDTLREIISEILDELRANIASVNEHESPTATGDRSAGDLLWWKDNLYIVVRDMDIGDAYIDYSDNPNVRTITVEEFVHLLTDELATQVESNTTSIGELTESVNGNTSRISALEPSVNNNTEAIAGITQKIANLDCVNVKDCGAVGDGVTDDTEAIQYALDNYDCVYIPNGTYMVSETLNMSKCKHLLGSNPDGAVIKRSDTRYGDTLTVSNKAFIIENIYFYRNLVVENETIANPLSTSTAHIHCIKCQGFTVRNCKIMNAPVGIDIEGSTIGDIIGNMIVTSYWCFWNDNMKESMYAIYIHDNGEFYSQLINITNNYIGGKTKSYARNVDGEVIDRAWECGAYNMIGINGCEGVNISQNYIGAGGLHNIFVNKGVDQTIVGNVKIHSNFLDPSYEVCVNIGIANGVLIEGNDFNMQNAGVGCLMVTSATSVEVTNNVFENSLGYGIYVVLNDDTININGNTFSNLLQAASVNAPYNGDIVLLGSSVYALVCCNIFKQASVANKYGIFNALTNLTQTNNVSTGITLINP